MLGGAFLSNAEWEIYPFVRFNPLVDLLVDASITSRSKYTAAVTAVTNVPDVQFKITDTTTGSVYTYNTATATVRTQVVYGDFTLVKSIFSTGTNPRIATVFLFRTDSLANVSGLEEELTAKASVVQEESLFSLNSFTNSVELIGQDGISLSISDTGAVEIGRDATSPCPENCPAIPLLTINSNFAGNKNVSLVGNCNSVVTDSINSILYLHNQCAPCFDCEEQAVLHNAIAATYNYYNQMITDLNQMALDYDKIRSKLLADATAAGDTLAIQEIQKYMPSNLFLLK